LDFMGSLIGLQICKMRIPRTSELVLSFLGITRVCHCGFVLIILIFLYISIHHLVVVIFCPCQFLFSGCSTRTSRDVSKVLSLEYTLFNCGWPPFGSHYIFQRYIHHGQEEALRPCLCPSCGYGNMRGL
jgi:hypothetical protein